MPAAGGARSIIDFEGRLVDPAVPGSFSESELGGLPDPVRCYFSASIAPGTGLARSARFRMRGSIKLGGRWLRFRGHEVLSPHRGFVWAARVAWLIAGSDRYLEGDGSMEWQLLGLVRVARGEGPDISRSSAARAGAEAVWVPTALLPRFGVGWTAGDAHHITARYQLDEVELTVHCVLDDDALVRSVALERWGDPDATGRWGRYPFGFEATAHATFDGLTIPSAGRAGWFLGTDRWTEGEFFRYEISDYRLVTQTA